MNALTKIEEDVPIYEVAPRSRWVTGGVEYIYEERLPGGHKVARVDDMKVNETFTHVHLHHLIQASEIVIDEGFFSSVKANLRLMTGKKTFSDLTQAQAVKVIYKKAWCDRYLRLEASDRSVKRSDAKLEIAIKRISEEFRTERKTADERRRAENGLKKKRGGSKQESAPTDPSVCQIRRWVARYQKGGYHEDALIDLYNGPGPKRTVLCAEGYELHSRFAAGYASSTRPSMRQQFDLLEIALNDADAKRAETGKPPLRRLKRKAFEAMINALDPFFVTLGREGPDAALRLHGIVNQGLDVEKPFERLEMDEWNVSLMRILIDAGVWGLLEDWQREAVERARVWLSVAIDARTRMIVAMRFLPAAPCVESALSTIELAMTDKSRIAVHVGARRTYLHAKPRSIVMDNGVNYVADDVILALVRLNINPVHPPAGLKEMRGRVERIFGTLKTKIASYFSGQTFSNVVEKGAYDAQANAIVNVDELNRLFVVGVLDLYHNHPHEGLQGETPYDCMRRLSGVYGLPLPPNRDVLRHVMGVSCQRRIGAEGIRFLGIRYQSSELQRLRRRMGQRPVEIRIDRFDLSSISVRHDTGGWIVCDARFVGLENVSIWQWTEAVRDLQHRNASVAALSRHHVLSAVRTLSEAAAAAVERAEIANPVLTATVFEQFERALFKGFEFVDDGAYGDDLQLPADLARQVATTDLATSDTPEHGEGDEQDDTFGDATDWGSD
ncbi:Mu transposase C-terminal domain-containing protein [Aureimonas sp. AU22]|uniref:Mu transposase C-terminal domain-containing protein n=1 Tax=Aureimonas sp. AU22 TaxID=1638162 RepID=UPI000783BA44|nr:Mu transposase C-terminal domain-containing protein [Aureimonas sp. AU22]